MSDIQTTTVSEDGFGSTSQVGEFDMAIDPLDETGPNPNAALVATYASCFLPALRVAGQQMGHDDLGTIQIDADADLDEDDDLTGIRFTIHVEADLAEDEIDEFVERGEDICHVHSALREGLHAEITVNAGAF
ncbi:OsmC family protein [Salinirubrum litoreum]|uniref:OsmC family protein n=1 Tax=Salinirubrum litoreum TaxID=1126234 RepID=A0ABD5R7J7_9EURY|nr:OsmC family protein [Salinirubrum litoreum]